MALGTLKASLFDGNPILTFYTFSIFLNALRNSPLNLRSFCSLPSVLRNNNLINKTNVQN